MCLFVFQNGGKEEKNCKGEVIGLSEPRALYYFTEIGRRRIYRNTYPIPMYKGLELFKYKKKENAEKLCEEINKVYGDDFRVYEVGD